MSSSVITVDPEAVYLARLGSDHSRSTARSALRAAARVLGMERIDWAAVTYADLAAVRAGLGAYSSSWCNACWSIVRAVLVEARRLGLVDAGLVDDVRALPRARGTAGRLGRDVEDAEIGMLLDAADRSTLLGRRDGAVIAILAAGGLRCSEAIQVMVDDWDPSERFLTVVHGKGSRQRIVPLPAWAAERVDEWLIVHPGDGLLLRPIDRWRRVGPSLSARSLRAVLANLCESAGVERISPHALRAHRITEVLSASDPFAARMLAGHADLASTARYDRRGVKALDVVVQSIPAPDRPCRPRLVA